MDTLDQIAAEAVMHESEQEAAQEAAMNPEAEQQPAIDPALAWAQIPKMFGSILSMALPELDQVYTDQRCYAWGSAMSAVADKYGWDAAETMSRYAPEIALVVATIPLAVPTVKAIKAAADKAKPIEGEGLVRPAGEGASSVEE